MLANVRRSRDPVDQSCFGLRLVVNCPQRFLRAASQFLAASSRNFLQLKTGNGYVAFAYFEKRRRVRVHRFVSP